MAISSEDKSSNSPRRFIVQQFDTGGPSGDRWVDVAVVEAGDAGSALHRVVIADSLHRIQATTYRVSEEALLVNVSINLEAVDA